MMLKTWSSSQDFNRLKPSGRIVTMKNSTSSFSDFRLNNQSLFSESIENSNKSKKTSAKDVMQSMKLRLKSIKVYIIIFIVTVISLLYLRRSFHGVFLGNSDDSTVYSIVIDAGSTGSRIHVFKLNHLNQKSTHVEKNFDVELEKEELFIKIKPGLSSYSTDPDKAADSIKPLLDKALEVIPTTHHSITRLSLKATAGLRLLSDRIADKILNGIKGLFKSYPFLNNDQDVSILDGKYEGIYSWLTLNYALKSFKNSIESKTCSLDLGGGSTQVTFVPTEQITVLTTNPEDLVDFRLDENKYKIFAKSYLGFGLMSARMNIFKFDILRLLKKPTNNQNELSSVCLPVGHSSKWTQQGVEYTVIGPEKKEQHSFEKCSFNVVKTLENKFNAPVELRGKEIYAFSYYFDRLNNAKIFNESSGGNLKVQSILQKAISVCDDADSSENKDIDKEDKDYPFLCMDLTFIYSLLTVGYGIPNDKEINVHNEVNKMEISWALGAAFHMLNN